MGRALLLVGVLLVGLGLLLLAAERFGWPGRLPGDVLIRRKNFTFFFPITTCILLSVVLTLVMWMFHGRR